MITNSRIWVIAGVLLIVVIFVLGGLLGVKPQLDAAAANDSERAGVEVLNLQQRAELLRLREESAQTAAITAEVAELQELIPAEAKLDDLIGELAVLQTTYGVSITAYSSLDEALFMPTEEALATLPASITSNNFTTTAIQLSIAGSRDNMMAFVDGLQRGSRLFLASDITMSSVDTVDIKGFVYRLLETPVVDPTAAAVDGAVTDTGAVAE
ncbi:Tfp pilus assembly protein PilO [Conyzicola lurida]|uniref:Tfp pilus assembly protein PilO n=1 Tax=Conyzicola lurida TaxID=1172621 RepID=A0A841ADL7_9MICO|nr:hypothetical protein [Conyzicola lurida]MBB5841810.1 Tfp pilus assembly protein PilO [Conyzicola lurida]